MIASVIRKCLVMADADLFIICRQRAPDTENPIWITQLIRISHHKLVWLQQMLQRKEMCSIQQRKTISSEEARKGHKNDRIYCRDFPVEAYFSQLTLDVRITTQSDLYQANLTESHRTWLNLVKRPSYNNPEFLRHHLPFLYTGNVLLEFFDNIINVSNLDSD